MSRDIKFRVWDKHNQRMIDGIMAICSGEGGWILFTAETEGTDCSRAIHDIRQYEIMQFTGLTDRNGKEIYEGDILDDFHVSGSHSNLEAVMYQNAPYEGDYICAYGYHFSFPTQDLQIVGNIYQNSELLKPQA